MFLLLKTVSEIYLRIYYNEKNMALIQMLANHMKVRILNPNRTICFYNESYCNVLHVRTVLHLRQTIAYGLNSFKKGERKHYKTAELFK